MASIRRNRNALQLLLLVAGLLFLSVSLSQAQWVPANGPYGGSIYALVESDGMLFAGTAGAGIFRSSDNGTTWMEVNTGLTTRFVFCLASSGSNLFAGTSGGGVFLSTNGGTSWTAVNTGLTDPNVHALVISGGNLFAGTAGGGVFLSTNNGTSWAPVNSGLTFPAVYRLAVNGVNLFAGTLGGGVFHSINNGTSWTAVNTGLTNSVVTSLATSGSNLFAGTGGGGVFLSTNNGTSWAPVNTGLTSNVVMSLAISGSNLFAGTNQGGAFLSTNSGTTWTAINTGLANTNVLSLAITGSNLFAGTDGGGVFLSTNNGTSWTEVNTGLTGSIVYSLAVKSSNIFAGAGGGVSLSTNGGTIWTAVNTGLTNPIVYSLTHSGINLFAGAFGGGVFLSTNDGANWTTVNGGLTNTFVLSMAVSGSNVFAGTNGGGVFLSTNNGTSWAPVNSGLTNSSVRSLAISGSNVFAGTSGGGVFLSPNSGTSWTEVNTGLTNLDVRSLAVSGGNIFAGTLGGGVFLSTNSGTSWTQVNSGLTNTSVQTLAITGNNVFAGTEGGEVYFSSNNATSWTAINTGLTASDVYSLALTGSSVFAGTTSSVFSRPLSDLSLSTHPTDSLALVALYNSTNGAGWTSNTNWLTGPVNSWAGVSVSDGRVINLGLTSNNLVGTIPAALGNLTALTGLFLGENQLSGGIPSALGGLLSLEQLHLNNNFLTGTIPPALGSLSALTDLIIHTNQLKGNIPPELGSLSSLVDLRLSANQLSGPIPDELGSLANLEILYLCSNQLTGDVPSTFTNLSNLEQLDLCSNRLTGVPDLSGLPITAGTWANNFFTFEDLEPNSSLSVTFTPQTFGDTETYSISLGDPINLSFVVGGTANSYQWRLGATNVGTNANTFNVPVAALPDVGIYTLRVTSSLMPGVTLTSAQQLVQIKSEGLFEWVDAGELTDDGLNVIPAVQEYQAYTGQWGDFNNDGHDDIFVTGIATSGRSILYENNGDGTFSRIPYGSYFFSMGRNVSWADFDNDGWLDCYAPGPFLTSDSVNSAAILRNNGDETFSRIPLPVQGLAATWTDTDNDGDVDLVANVAGLVPLTLFRNDGAGTFTQLPALPGPGGFSWGTSALDIDGDGDLDLYSPLDGARTLHIGDGNNGFTVNTTSPLVTDALTSPRGASWADIDNDGDMDAYIMASSVDNAFYINDGAGQFARQTTLTILGETIFGGRGSAFADFNNDGYVDLLTTAGATPVWTLFYNNGNGTFTKQTNQNFRTAGFAPGASVSDYDNDGFLDIFSASFGLDYNGLYRNIGNSNNWLQLKLKGNSSNNDAIGAKVSVKAGGFWRHTQVIANNGFANQNSSVQQFGLGAATSADSIKIHWPSGKDQVLVNQSSNQRLNIEEPLAVATSDSLALVALYNATNGASWNNKTNWLTTPLATGNWFGVDITGQRVTGLVLQNNNLAGAIPASFTNLTELAILNIALNGLTSVPDLSGLTNLSSPQLQGNRLHFDDLEPNVSIPFIIYSPQDSVGLSQTEVIQIGQPYSPNGAVGGASVQYQWKKNNTIIAGATASTYSIPAVQFSDEGTFKVEATSSLVPGLTLFGRGRTLQVSTMTRDSIALRHLYDSTQGSAWTNKTNWLTTPLETGNWFGVTISDHKVTAVSLSNNNLTGNVPIQFGTMSELTAVDLSANKVTSVPGLAGLAQLASLKVENNRLEFDDLEPNSSIPGFTYAPQDSVDISESILRELNENVTWSTDVGGLSNSYQWKKNGTAISGATSFSLNLSNITFSDDAAYDYETTNSIVTGLTLHSRKKILRVSSLERDAIALTALYNSTGGPSWTNKTNWITTPLGTGNWFGVTITSNRVTGLDLRNNNLTGSVPVVLADVKNLLTLNLSSNKITALPDFAPLINLTTLDVSSNMLDFKSLVSNTIVTGINYANQAEIGAPLYEVIDQGSNFPLKVSVKGDGNVYKWTRNGATVNGASDSTHTITSIGRGNMGTYVAEITNPAVPGLVLKSAAKTVLASATLSGRLLESADVPVTVGQAKLLRVTSTGGYDTTAIKDINSDGTYLMEKIILDDYILVGIADTLVHVGDLPTYYNNKLFWEQADTLFVNENLPGLDITIIDRPTAKPTGEGILTGILTDSEDSNGGRTQIARVKGAAVAVSRKRKVGRPQDVFELTLVAYTYTDENGEFEVTDLELGDYAINIQYPGYPMDPNSFVDFTIGQGIAKKVGVDALVTGNKIVVRKVIITGWDETEKRFSVYPNPASAVVNVDIYTKLDGLTYSITNTLGQSVLNEDLAFGTTAIDVATLTPGVYHVQIMERGDVLSTFRIVISY